MIDTLFPYYERELIFIRQFAQDFAKQYPAAASGCALTDAKHRPTHRTSDRSFAAGRGVITSWTTNFPG